MDVEGGTLGWSTSGAEEWQPVAGDEMQKTTAATGPKKAKYWKYTSRKTHPLCIGVDRELRELLFIENEAPHFDNTRDAQ